MPPTAMAAGQRPLPFLYESTGIETHFNQGLDPAPRACNVFAFHQPVLLAEWLKLLPLAPTFKMIRDHIAASLGIEIDDFDLPPFSQQGGLGRVHQLFGSELPPLLAELNRELNRELAA